MKRIAIILVVLLNSLTSIGQQNIFPRTFPKTDGVKEVIAVRDCSGCTPQTKNELFAKYFFDENGLNTIRFRICENELCGKQFYAYQDGQIISYQNYGTWVSTPGEADLGMVWDSTLSSKTTYQYTENKLTNIKQIRPSENQVSSEIDYIYDDNGQLKKEEFKTYPDPNVSVQFKPNSTEWTSNPDSKRLSINKKEYEYKGNITTISYYKESTLTAVETVERNDNGLILKSSLRDINGKILKQEINTYDNKGQLIEARITDSCYSGFGTPYDCADREKTTYEYDDKGNLILKKLYSGGKVFNEVTYEYNDQGNLVLQRSYSGEQISTEMRFEYVKAE